VEAGEEGERAVERRRQRRGRHAGSFRRRLAGVTAGVPDGDCTLRRSWRGVPYFEVRGFEQKIFFEKSATPSDSYYFFADIDVSKHILVLDTSILAKNNMNNVFVCRKTPSHCIFGRTYRIVKKES
jgi:hypothetical protein